MKERRLFTAATIYYTVYPNISLTLRQYSLLYVATLYADKQVIKEVTEIQFICSLKTMVCSSLLPFFFRLTLLSHPSLIYVALHACTQRHSSVLEKLHVSALNHFFLSQVVRHFNKTWLQMLLILDNTANLGSHAPQATLWITASLTHGFNVLHNDFIIYYVGFHKSDSP